ncbi:MAG: cation:proton antiporter [Thermoflavifilum sp.]|nr:cation:proton antiporter [Thermoflavifilum sp.]MCL6515015.1 cation:proton antiporter [Alicyclobacillus sp.]
MDSPQMLQAQDVLRTLLLLFGLGTLGGKLAERLRVPDVVVYVLLGMLLGPQVLGLVRVDPQSVVYPVILIGGAAFIIYHGGMVTELTGIGRVWRSVTALSTVGLVATALVVGVGGALVLHLPFMDAFLLGAIVASTDPAALVPIFQRLPVRPHVAHTVISESAFTDATGAILTTIVLGLLTPGEAVSGAGLVWMCVRLVAGGLFVGAVVGWLTAFLISENDRGLLREYTPMVTVLSVLSAYTAAEWLGASGFMAVFVAGIMVGNAMHLRLTILPRQALAAHGFVEAIGLKARMLIFLLLGAQVDFGALADHIGPALAITAIFIVMARPLTVLISVPWDKRAGWRWREVAFLFWTRETGVIAAALTGIVSASRPDEGALLSAVVFVIILVTLLLQASTTPWLARRLGLLTHSTHGPAITREAAR